MPMDLLINELHPSLFLIPFLIIALFNTFFGTKQPKTKEDEYRKLLQHLKRLIDKELRK